MEQMDLKSYLEEIRRKNEQKHSYCFFSLHIDIPSNEPPEDAQVAIEEYNNAMRKGIDCTLRDPRPDQRCMRQFKNGKEIVTPLYEHLLNPYARASSWPAWCIIEDIMKGTNGARSMYKPLHAAIEAEAIERPTWPAFKKQFAAFDGKKGFNDSDFSYWLKDDNPYAGDKEYDDLLEIFKNIVKEYPRIRGLGLH